MAFGSDRSANFVIKAKDAATGPIGKIGGALGSLKSSAGTAFKALAAGAIAAASAIAGLTFASIKGAVEDEMAQARLVATLRARGKATEENLKKVEAAIAAGQKLAFTDDDVRSAIEVATQFTNSFSKALKIQAVAQDLAIAKGISLEQATNLVGRAFAGSGNSLKKYGIDLQKTVYWTEQKIDKDRRGNEHEIEVTKTRKETIKGMEALALITAKYGGIAQEVSQTSAVRFAAAQIAINEAFESFGARFLPAVATGLEFFSTEIIPRVEDGLAKLGDGLFDVGKTLTQKGGVVDSFLAVAAPIGEKLSPKIQELADNFGKLLGTIGELVVALWDDGEGPLAIAISAIGGAFDLFLGIVNGVIEAIEFLIDLVTEALKLFDRLGKKAQGQAAFPTFTGGGGAYGGGGGGAGGGGMSPYPTGPIGANVVIGTNALSSLDLYFGSQALVATGRRTGGRP